MRFLVLGPLRVNGGGAENQDTGAKLETSLTFLDAVLGAVLGAFFCALFSGDFTGELVVRETAVSLLPVLTVARLAGLDLMG